MRSLQPLCKSQNNSEYYVTAKLSGGMERGFNFGLFFCYCCGLVVNLYRKKQKPGYKSIGRQIPVVYVMLCVTCARPRDRGKTN